MTESQWTTYSFQPPKKQRAGVACVTCHSKKIRCDLQVRRSTGHNSCSACIASNSDCQPRLSKRERHRQSQVNHASTKRTDHARQLENGQRTPASQANQSLVSNGSRIIPQGSHTLSPSSTHSSSVPHSIRSSQQYQRQDRFAATEHRDNSLIGVGSVDSSRTEQGTMSGYVGDTGFLNVYGPEHEHDAHNQSSVLEKTIDPPNLIQPDLLQSFAETYFEYCYPWCPVLDKHDLFSNLNYSPLLTDALAIVGSHVQPPILPHLTPAEYYDRARKRFYDDEEPDILLSLRAISLFYWWSSRAPTLVHRHSSWWWSSVIIRHAQQLGIHRDPPPGSISEETRGIRRRLWWTVFARERLTAVCQGKPCIIDPDDCDIKEVSREDFPQDADPTKADVFIYWVRLCSIIGKVAKYLSKSSHPSPMPPSEHPSKELIGWVTTLPHHLSLPIEGDRTTNFNRDVHQLYLPYLAVIIVLHVKRSENSLPIASSTAILAATCIARIFKDILVRGGTRFLMPINCWYCATAFYALSQASKRNELKTDVEEELDILYATIKELQKMWGTANVFEQGFRRLRASVSSHEPETVSPSYPNYNANLVVNAEDDGIHWLDYFPFVTAATSPIAKTILAEQDGMPYFFPDFSDNFLSHQYLDLFESLDHFAGQTEI